MPPPTSAPSPGEHTETRTTVRNGQREKVLTTQAGDLDLAIPKKSGPIDRPWTRREGPRGRRTL
ncbi:transposase [Streptomyces sp. NPDC056987]|uniref:transposase n=1 Tax=Streptomyces sp. NPDC056987 TaxID=3345988 RepID=UPI00363F67A5